jgi:Xaa-Pro aminopeptidase
VDQATRRERLAARLPELEADAFLITRLPNVRYLTGFSGSNGQLVLTSRGGAFLTDGRYAEQARREVPELRRSIYSNDFVGAFAAACRELAVGKVAFEAGGVTYKTFRDLSGSGFPLVATDREVERIRWVKDHEEIKRLDAAQAIGDVAFEKVIGRVAGGITEKQLALEIDTVMRGEGADGLSFDTIVGFGENAAEPHHHPTDRPLAPGDVIKMDFGSIVDGYHSDMTRTVAFGEPSPRLKEVYEVVRRAQLAGVQAIRAGVTGGEADAAAREVVREAGYGEQFKHSLGHGVGLEIHEEPWLRTGGDHVLPAGAVVTVEPGVYLEGEGGVRVEDMVEVTPEGCRVIAKSPKELMVL